MVHISNLRGCRDKNLSRSIHILVKKIQTLLEVALFWIFLHAKMLVITTDFLCRHECWLAIRAESAG